MASFFSFEMRAGQPYTVDTQFADQVVKSLSAGGATEPYGVAEDVAHRPARRCDFGLRAAGWIEPGAMGAGLQAVVVGNCCNQCRESARSCGIIVLVWSVVASRMKAQGLQVRYACDAT